MKRILTYLIRVLLLLVLLAACAPVVATSSPAAISTKITPTDSPTATALPPIHLKVGVFNFISSAPLFIARDEGYFAEQGLDIELIDFGSASNEVIPALVARELDATANSLSAAVFNAILQGNNLKYVADKGFINPNNCTTDAWVANKNVLASGSLDDPSTLKGKNFIFTSGGTVEYALDVLLTQKGLTQNDINFTNVSDSVARIEGLNNGSADVSILSEPWITRAQTAGSGEVWVPFSDIIPNLSLGVIIFGPGILEDKPEAGTRFMIAYLKAIEQFNQGKTDRNIEIIANFTKLSLEDVKASCWTSFKADASIDTETLLTFQNWAVEKGYVDESQELNQFWTSQFIDEASKKINK